MNNNWVQLQTDIAAHKSLLSQAARTVVDQDVSNYPIFFAYDAEVNAPGLPVTQVATTRGTTWTINLTTLEELATKQIIAQDKIDPFRKVYKQSEGQLCFLIVDTEGARFGFVPGPTA